MTAETRETLTLILSIVGAGAWLPAILSLLLPLMGRIHGSLVDARFVYNFTLNRDEALGPHEEQKGHLMIVAFDFIVYNRAFLAKKCDVEIQLKDKRRFKNPRTCEGDMSINVNGVRMTYRFPPGQKMSVCHLLNPGQDNIRIFCWLLTDMDPGSRPKMEDIQRIRLTFHSQYFKKTVVIRDCAKGLFSLPKYIQSYLK